LDKERQLLVLAASFSPNVLQERDLTERGEHAAEHESELLWRPSPIYDANAKKARLFHEIFSKIYKNSVGSKEMLKRIKQKVYFFSTLSPPCLRACFLSGIKNYRNKRLTR